MSVWQATDSITGQELGLRLFDIKHFSSSDTFQRFVDYLSRLQNLRRTNILPILETGEHKSVYYLTMPYLPGASICDLINRLGPLPESLALRTITGIANGLNYAHNEGFLHLNLHPNNVFFDGEFGPFISDFALPGFLGEHDLQHAGYQAPEIWQKGKIGAYTDVYGLGAMIYQLLVGHPVFSASNIDLLRTQQIDQVINFPAHVSRDMQHIIKKCLHQNINARYQSVTEVLTDLQSKSVYNLGITPKQESNFFKNNTEENFFYDLELLSDVGEGEIDFFSSGDTLKTDNEPFLDGQTVKVIGETASLPGFLNTHSEGEQYQEGFRFETGGYSELEAFGPSDASEKKQKRLFYILLILVVLLSTTIAFLLGRRSQVMKVEKSDTPLAGIIETQTLSPQETMVNGNARQTSVAVTATNTPSLLPTSTPKPTIIKQIPVVFTHDPQKLQVLNEDNQFDITEILRLEFGEHIECHDIAWSPNGGFFAVLTKSTLLLYDGYSFDLLERLETEEEYSAIKWSPAGEHIILYNGWDLTRENRVFALVKGFPNIQFLKKYYGKYINPVWSSNGDIIATALDNKILIINSNTGVIENNFESNFFEVSGLAFSNHSNMLAADYKTDDTDYLESRKIIIWDVNNSIKLYEIPAVGWGSMGWLKNDSILVFSNTCGNTYMINPDECGTVVFWDAVSKIVQNKINDCFNKYCYFVSSPDGKMLMIEGSRNMESNIDIWRLDSMVKTFEIELYVNNLSKVSWSPDSKFIAAYYNHNTGMYAGSSGLQIYNVHTGEGGYVFEDEIDKYSLIARWSPDGKRIALHSRTLEQVFILGVPD